MLDAPAPSPIVDDFVPQVVTVQDSELSGKPGKSFMDLDVRSEVPHPPEVPGGYLEPSHHVFSREAPLALFDALLQALKNVHTSTIDIIPQKEKFKLKCVAYRPGETAVPFNARVFTAGSDGQGPRYAVEFQRRSGCVMHFAHLWQSCKYFLQTNGHCEGAAKASPPAIDVHKLGMPSAPSSENTRSTIKCLLQMAQSQFADVKTEGIQGLVKLSAPGDPATAKIMVEEGCGDAFFECMSSPAEDLSRLAISGLTNLAFVRAEVWQTVVSKGGLVALCQRVQQDQVSPCVQVVRECSRALKGVITHLGKKAGSESDLQGAIKALCRHTDPFVHKMGQDMQALASGTMRGPASVAVESL
jgi:hypothetical protein